MTDDEVPYRLQAVLSFIERLDVRLSEQIDEGAVATNPLEHVEKVQRLGGRNNGGVRSLRPTSSARIETPAGTSSTGPCTTWPRGGQYEFAEFEAKAKHVGYGVTQGPWRRGSGGRRSAEVRRHKLALNMSAGNASNAMKRNGSGRASRLKLTQCADS
ncbi:MAG: hypothetical protein EOP82_06940 [Variovorax sp.]|nr:MAG: hypothetical protein EOP82_06940 [Variovorax sp.]